MNNDSKLPEKWVETTLGYLIKIKHGFAFKGKFINVENNHRILITPGNFKIGGGFNDQKLKYYHGEIPKEYILKSDDIIITMTDLSKLGDTLGYSAKVPLSEENIYLHNQRIGLVEFKNAKIDSDFLYWLTRNRYYQKSILNSSTGSTVRHTSPIRIQEYSFLLPPINEQKSIASILSSFDDKIELLRQQNETLEKIAQTVFNEWFGKYQVGDELPEGWRVGKLGEICKISSGKRPKNISNKKTDFHNIPLIGATKIMGYVENFLYDEKILVIGRVGTHGKIQRFESKVWASDNTLIIKSGYYIFTYQVFQSIDYSKLNRGAVQPLITQSDLKNLKLVIPDNKALERYGQIADLIFKKINSNLDEILTLSQTRDIILPKLMSGKIRVINE